MIDHRRWMQLRGWSGRGLLALTAAAVGYLLGANHAPRAVEDGIEHAPDPIVELDGLGRITLFNRAAEALSGHDRAEVLGRHFTMTGLLARSSCALAVKNFAIAVAGLEMPRSELTVQTKDGRSLIVESNSSVRRRAGVLQSMQIVLREIPEGRDQQVALEEANRRIDRERQQFLSLAESMSSGLLLADPNGDVAYVNAPLTDFTGVSPERTIGRPLAVLARAIRHRMVDPEQFDLEFGRAQQTLASHPFFDIDLAGARRRVYEVSCFPVVDVWPSGAGFGCLVRDVTDAREVDFRKTEFVAVASHELRTPLTGILGFSELLSAREGLDETARGWAQHIAEEAVRLSSTADDLLNVAQIESGALSLVMKELELGDVMDEIQQHFAARVAPGGAAEGAPGLGIPVATGGAALVEPASHALEVRVDQPVQIAADPDKLRAVLINLIDNALKYSPDGGTIRVHVTATPSEVQVAVSDPGVGMSEGSLAHVFERFRRIDRNDTATIRGAGLGLYIVRAFVESMGGSIAVTSELGRGSTFTVTLPRTEVSRAA